MNPGVPTDPIAARLASIPGIQRVPAHRLELFVLKHFIGEEECAALCRLIDANRRPSTLADDQGIDRFRTSETCDLDTANPLVADVQSRLADVTGIPRSHGEPLQGQRYAPGQEFRPHTDSFNPGGADYFMHCAEAGQRSWTAMVYLNQPEEGGATRFKAVGKTIQPEAGKLLIWNNLLSDGSPNAATLHQGMRVRRGTKYVLTQWYRERPFA
jgi:prolyl 4-hydroxylase